MILTKFIFISKLYGNLELRIERLFLELFVEGRIIEFKGDSFFLRTVVISRVIITENDSLHKKKRFDWTLRDHDP